MSLDLNNAITKYDKNFYLEHPIIGFDFTKRPKINFSHEHKYRIQENEKTPIFIESFNNCVKNLYPIYFNNKISETAFESKKWTNLFILNSNYLLRDDENYPYALFLITNNDTIENYLQAFCDLFKYVDIEKTKTEIQTLNEELFNYLDIDFVVEECNKIGIQQTENILERHQDDN